jgi:cobalt-zinc-cadmium efflux system membrane fusion protein
VNRYLSLGTAVLSLLWLNACHRLEAQTPEVWTVNNDVVRYQAGAQVPGVRTAQVAPAGQSLGHFPGRLVWSDESTARVFTPFNGRVERILVRPGEVVHAGQALVALSSGEFGQAQTEARKARADLDGSTAQFNRARDLNAAGVVARREFEQAQMELSHAEAEWSRASARLKVFGESATVVNGKFVLRSPIGGIVVERAVNPGTEVRTDATQPLFVITNPMRLTLLLDVPEADSDRIATGAEVHFALSSDPATQGSTHIQQIAAFVEPASRAVKARAAVDNVSRRFRGEAFVEADVALGASSELEVPADALLLIGPQYYVFVADGHGGFRRQPVQTSNLGRARVGIGSGLRAGQQIVVDGGLYLEQLLESGGKS